MKKMSIVRKLYDPTLVVKGIFVEVGAIFLVENLYEHFKIVRNYKDVLYLRKLPEVLREDIDAKKDLSQYNFSGTFVDIITDFIGVFQDKKHIDLTNLYENLHSNCFKKINDPFSHNNFYGEYSLDSKNIYYDGDDVERIIYHELFHMASTRQLGDYFYCGFSQLKFIYKDGSKKKTWKFDIGVGLTEGYTELLSWRYFGSKNIEKCYHCLVDIANYIEVIVGREAMEEAYFKGDLLGLVDKLSIYIPRKEVLGLIKDTDYIFRAIYEESTLLPTMIAKQKYQSVLKTISRALSRKAALCRTEDLRCERAAFYSIKNHRCSTNSGVFKLTKRTKRTLQRESEEILNGSPNRLSFSKKSTLSNL